MAQMTEGKAGLPQPGLDAAREGRSFHMYADDVTPGANEVTLTDETLVHNLKPGYRAIVKQIVFGVTTVSDDCEFRLVSCSEPDGGGTTTQLMVHRHVVTGNAITSKEMFEQDLTPPLSVPYGDDAKSISFLVDANDAGAEITVGFSGWDELDMGEN
jgi:hypothetical protein